MFLTEEIQKRNTEFLQICVKNDIERLYAFGSSVTNHFNKEKSDIDLAVEINETDPLERGAKLIELWDELEKFFDRSIDLLTNDSIKNPVLKKIIDRTKVLIYDRRSQKVYS